jgi:hypothetical protein
VLTDIAMSGYPDGELRIAGVHSSM